eukprot:CAMPEP_0175119546 /NCGR_PEP_ID=MMETSP0087-20121206/118_1 /TAXON_ID=136419 /ORGANISM="Unknown Unknown, Strain D1" /LENGTH=344 /DNA_ID=CAMNT_0016400879 /DNA_START=1 /DNA_END=1035 /DNA_ORIENTATION=+
MTFSHSWHQNVPSQECEDSYLSDGSMSSLSFEESILDHEMEDSFTDCKDTKTPPFSENASLLHGGGLTFEVQEYPDHCFMCDGCKDHLCRISIFALILGLSVVLFLLSAKTWNVRCNLPLASFVLSLAVSYAVCSLAVGCAWGRMSDKSQQAFVVLWTFVNMCQAITGVVYRYKLPTFRDNSCDMAVLFWFKHIFALHWIVVTIALVAAIWLVCASRKGAIVEDNHVTSAENVVSYPRQDDLGPPSGYDPYASRRQASPYQQPFRGPSYMPPNTQGDPGFAGPDIGHRDVNEALYPGKRPASSHAPSWVQPVDPRTADYRRAEYPQQRTVKFAEQDRVIPYLRA